MLAFYPMACTVVNYSNTPYYSNMPSALIVTKDAAGMPTHFMRCHIILSVSDHGPIAQFAPELR
jgi:hypothetical protein